MAVLATRRHGPPKQDHRHHNRSKSRMTIRTEHGKIVLSAPYAPREVNYSNLALTWTEVPRPGRRPINAAAGKPLPKIAFTLTLAHRDQDGTVEGAIERLRKLADTEARLVVSYGPSESGLWNLTQLTIDSQQRHPENDSITQATAQVEFTRCSEGRPRVSPLHGGHKGKGGSKAKTYTVRKGDTLHRIAVRVYDDPSMWRAIADKNKIRHPKKDARLKPGTRLKMPAVGFGKAGDGG